MSLCVLAAALAGFAALMVLAVRGILGASILVSWQLPPMLPQLRLGCQRTITNHKGRVMRVFTGLYNEV